MPTDFRELSDLRTLIEGFGARYAAKRVAQDPEKMVALQEVLQRLIKAIRRGDYPAFREADTQLHETVMSIAGVSGLTEVWKIVWEKLAAFHQRGFREGVSNLRTHIGEHEYLVEMIGLGEPAAAEDAARSHIEASWVRIAAASSQGNSSAHSPLHLASAHIAAHLQYPLRLEDIASKVAFTSAGNLSRLFRLHHGLSFKAYLQRLRMTKAAELLVNTDIPISTIARRVGYRNLSLFSLHFARYYQSRPREWRKEKGQTSRTLKTNTTRAKNGNGAGKSKKLPSEPAKKSVRKTVKKKR